MRIAHHHCTHIAIMPRDVRAAEGLADKEVVSATTSVGASAPAACRHCSKAWTGWRCRYCAGTCLSLRPDVQGSRTQNSNAPRRGDSRFSRNYEDERRSAGAHDSQADVDPAATLAKRAVAARLGNYSSLHIKCIAADGLVLEPTYEHPNLVVDPYGQVAKVYEDPDTQEMRIVTAREWKATCEVRQHGALCYFWNSCAHHAHREVPDSIMSPPDLRGETRAIHHSQSMV